jgi:hypothetical protein
MQSVMTIPLPYAEVRPNIYFWNGGLLVKEKIDIMEANPTFCGYLLRGFGRSVPNVDMYR